MLSPRDFLGRDPGRRFVRGLALSLVRNTSRSWTKISIFHLSPSGRSEETFGPSEEIRPSAWRNRCSRGAGTQWYEPSHHKASLPKTYEAMLHSPFPYSRLSDRRWRSWENVVKSVLAQSVNGRHEPWFFLVRTIASHLVCFTFRLVGELNKHLRGGEAPPSYHRDCVHMC